MPIRRNPETIIETLFERIAKAKSPAPKLDGSSNADILKEQFEKIEKELKDMKRLFPRVKYWEELVVQEFDGLEQDIAGESFDNFTEEKINEKFLSMNEKIDKIKAMNSKIELQSVIDNKTSGKPRSGQSTSKDWKMSLDWQQLSIEKQILMDPVMKILQVSYDNLELQSKLCLLCFSIFPQKSFIKKRPLIYWWIGEGLVTTEAVGEEVLEKLLIKGMINPVRKNRRPMVSSFTMHPWIRRMVISVAKKAGFFDFDDTGKLAEDESPISRRVCFLSPSVKPPGGNNSKQQEVDKTQVKPPAGGSVTSTSSLRQEEVLHQSYIKPPGGNVATASNLEEIEVQQTHVNPPDGSVSNGNSSKQNEVHQTHVNQPDGHLTSDSGLGQETTKALNGVSAKDDSTPRQEEKHQTITLFNVNQKYLDIELELFMKHPKLVVLQLGRWQNSTSHHIEVEKTEFLEALGDLKHLRYLSFRGISRITDLPKSIAKLTRLQILDLRACHNLEKLPVGIKAMKKLTHLDVSECYLLEQMPKGLQALTDLQVLKGFVIANSVSKDPCRLKDLSNLKKLRKLSLIIGRDAIVAEEDLLELKEFGQLRILSITWGGVIKSVNEEATLKKAATMTESNKLARAATMTTSHLSMPQSLEKLDLRCFPKKGTPLWLNPGLLQSLKRLYIRGGMLCSLGNNANGTWKVNVLRLKFLKDLEMEWLQLHESFPDLEYLETKKCDKLDSFQCDEEGIWLKGN
ncbi:Disease resistance rpp13-like protein [Thalictrum thalictroides]|uniref:Disease resistance rpp13-like protein n=1 Tax=Thalictrum thalictroides TaxID=46969 RepID=A0A7J6W8X3_THATH|nr:Disease resistance rpp13-like protein [Thalictrum thalictroides]